MRDDPFASLGALDQKLFKKPAPPPAAPTVEKRSVPASTPGDDRAEQSKTTPLQVPTNQEVGKEGRREVGNEEGMKASFPTTNTAPPIFDLNDRPYRKDSYLFTNEEFEAMEDLKIELRRKFDLKATKNDLARCAIGFLVEDFRKSRDRSIVVRRLQTKK
jgi:hypothetical protein